VIVLTDGIDSGRGSTTLEGALQSLLKAQASVYVVSNTEISRATKRIRVGPVDGWLGLRCAVHQLRIDDLREGLRVLDRSEQNLEQLTEATGGRLYNPIRSATLASTYAEVAEELRHQFGLYYTPLNKARDGSFRRVRVETTRPFVQSHDPR